jgi:hypothetical protein
LVSKASTIAVAKAIQSRISSLPSTAFAEGGLPVYPERLHGLSQE